MKTLIAMFALTLFVAQAYAADCADQANQSLTSKVGDKTNISHASKSGKQSTEKSNK